MNDWITSSYCNSSDCIQISWIKSSYSGMHDCVEMAWIKSSHSVTGNCVEMAWTKASHSADSANCVEVSSCTCEDVLVRDSKDPDGPKLQFPKPAFADFLTGVKAGEFD